MTPPSIPTTHLAVAVTTPGQPLHLVRRPTTLPSLSEALIHVTWTGSSPIDLHRADGGLLLGDTTPTNPFILGCTFGGTVVALGSNSSSSHLAVGDTVYGFVQDGAEQEAGYQEYVTVPTWKVSKLPSSSPLSLQEAVTVPGNLVTAMHVVTEDLGLALPWPVTPPPTAAGVAGEGILVWGAASGVGMYVVQVLRHWGYGNVLAVASARHHGMLKELGARVCFDYRKEGVVEEILGYVEKSVGNGGSGPKVPFIVDCIGSTEGTLRPLTKIAEPGSKVGVMLPVINVHAGQGQEPDLEMDVSKVLPGEWKEGVELKGTRTFFYAKNEFFKNHLQPEIVPALLEQGVIQPNKQRIVEGKTMLERAQNALNLLRDQAVSGEKLVWRVADEAN
ncbi:chaperonin 10-like protein [Chaetomidium leptoderma]|uniref:Chaperonin 10-like protein n=1 Tax=Chaetomidium leptoderma TaxID=669021 RepID=A0AAN6VMM1_9PEZI|nr:chaperonin 10-like protein [Chaetomidium leptoderma]